jgi:drug/metabolite transporter (DMT)-like permease
MLTRHQWGGLVLLTLIWGINWPVMKFSLRELTPLFFRATTMTGGAIALMMFFRWRGVSLKLPRHEIARVAWLALPNILGWHLFSIFGLQALASGRASILGFTMPVWTILISVLFLGQPMTHRVWLSVVAATAAVGLLSFQELTRLTGNPLGVLWMQLAAVSWATGTILMRRTQSSLPTETVTVWMMLMASAIFWCLALSLEPLPWPQQFSTGMWWALVYGVVMNYGYAQVIWFGLARSLPPAASAFSVMAVPLVGISSAAAIVGEIPHGLDWVAAGCIMVAIASALIPKKSQST